MLLKIGKILQNRTSSFSPAVSECYYHRFRWLSSTSNRSWWTLASLHNQNVSRGDWRPSWSSLIQMGLSTTERNNDHTSAVSEDQKYYGRLSSRFLVVVYYRDYHSGCVGAHGRTTTKSRRLMQEYRESSSSSSSLATSTYRILRVFLFGENQVPPQTGTTDDGTTKTPNFSTMMRTYGPVFLGTYIGVYLTTLSGLYTGVASGILDPVSLFSTLGVLDGGDTTIGGGSMNNSCCSVDLVYNFFNHYTMTQSHAHYVQEYPALANFGVAWIAAKFTEPARIPVAIFITPRVARYLAYRPNENEEKKDE